MTTHLRRATCPSCGRVLAVQPPAGGDGSADVFPRHDDGRGERCEYGRMIVHNDSYCEPQR